jgi:hypothetical protein
MRANIRRSVMKPDYKNWMPKGMVMGSGCSAAVFLILSIVSALAPISGGMQSFVQKLKDMGYSEVKLVDTTSGMFMSKWESTWMGLSGSAILMGRK